MPGSRIIMGERMVVGERMSMPSLPDVTPNDPNFSNINGSGFQGTQTVTIAGLDAGVSVLLSLSITGGSGSTPIGGIVVNSADQGTINVSVQNGDQVSLTAFVLGGTASGWIGTLTNGTDGNAIVDTISINLTP